MVLTPVDTGGGQAQGFIKDVYFEVEGQRLLAPIPGARLVLVLHLYPGLYHVRVTYGPSQNPEKHVLVDKDIESGAEQDYRLESDVKEFMFYDPTMLSITLVSGSYKLDGRCIEIPGRLVEVDAVLLPAPWARPEDYVHAGKRLEGWIQERYPGYRFAGYYLESQGALERARFFYIPGQWYTTGILEPGETEITPLEQWVEGQAALYAILLAIGLVAVAVIVIEVSRIVELQVVGDIAHKEHLTCEEVREKMLSVCLEKTGDKDYCLRVAERAYLECVLESNKIISRIISIVHSTGLLPWILAGVFGFLLLVSLFRR